MKFFTKWSINISSKARLRSALDWFAAILLAAIALVFIYSAQVFQEQKQQAWANVFTTGGSLMLSLVSLHMGSRIQQGRDKREESRATRKNEVAQLKIYIRDVSDIAEQLKRAESQNNEGRENESDLIRLIAKKKFTSLQENYPSTNIISDHAFRCKIESTIDRIGQACDDVIAQSASVQELNDSLQSALFEIQRYESIE
jgi:hypothetical protein